MSIDLATLNLKVDSTDVAKGVGELDKLTAAGTKTEQSTNRLTASFDRAGDEASALRSEQIALTAAMNQQARVAVVANDNMGRINTTSRAMRANMINLGRQVQDVGTMFALGAPPMQIFASQGAQVADVLAMMSAEAREANTSLTRMAAGGLARMAPFALAAAGAGAALSVVLNELTDDINENSDVTVTWGDTALGTFDAVRAYVSGALTQAFEALGIDLEAIFDGISAVARHHLNLVISRWVTAKDLIIAAWQTFPGAFAEFVINAANGALQYLENLINGSIGLLNTFVERVNGVIGTNLAGLAEVDLPEITNRFAGAGAAAGAAMAGAVEGGYRDYFGDFTDFVSPFAEARARARLEGDAEEAGKAAGRRMGRAAGAEMRREVEDAMAALKASVIAEAETAAEIASKDLEAITNIKSKNSEAMRAAEALAEEERRLAEDRIRDMANLYETLFTDGVGGVWNSFEKQGLAAISMIAAEWTLAQLSGQTGAGNSLGGIAQRVLSGSPLGSVFGGAANDNGKSGTGAAGGSTGESAASSSSMQSTLGSIQMSAGISSITNSILGGSNTAKIGGQVGGQIGGAIGAAYGPLGQAVGGVLGSLIGNTLVGAVVGKPKGIANLSGTDILSSRGKLEEQALGAGGSVLGIIADLANALGVDIGAGGAVSIGLRGNNFRVDPTGGGATKTGRGAIDFGEDQEAAIAFAVRNLIEDGVLTGISEASRKILTNGSADLQKAIEKAILIESVPKLLKERLDPLGFALDQIDEQFQSLADALREGGATAQQFADAERLYRLERESAIEQFGSAARTLQDFLSGLAFGSNSPLSVRSQLASAESAFSTFEADIAAGRPVDQDRFTAAAQTLLGLSRQANGSSGAFFSTFDKVRSLTQQAITNVGTSTPGEGVVFQQQTASNTQSIAAMTEETNALLREQNAYLSQLIANDNGTFAGFIGTGRGYVA